jgi:hypothetical protein
MPGDHLAALARIKGDARIGLGLRVRAKKGEAASAEQDAARAPDVLKVQFKQFELAPGEPGNEGVVSKEVP